MKLLPWLRFFRVVNLPTVPGDVLVGAGVVAGLSSHATGMSRPPCLETSCCSAIIWAAVAACAFYLFGLADNDIVGAKTDGSERPIPAGEISMGAARVARALCLLAAVGAGLLGGLAFVWWVSAGALLVLEIGYNRTKWAGVMGLCRGLNVVCGAAVVLGSSHATGMSRPLWVAAGLALMWTVYIWAVTKCSEGEDKDPAKKQHVGFLIGALVYLQLIVLLVAHLHAPNGVTRGALLGGAAMLIALRFLKGVLPKVSAS